MHVIGEWTSFGPDVKARRIGDVMELLLHADRHKGGCWGPLETLYDKAPFVGSKWILATIAIKDGHAQLTFARLEDEPLPISRAVARCVDFVRECME